MSIGRSKEEQELTDMLSKTLVQKEVMEPMNKIGWGHGTPPAPDYSGQPAPAEGAPGQAASPSPAQSTGQPGQPAAAAPAPNDKPKADGPVSTDLTAMYESLRDPETGLIGKKYKTVEEAIKGSGHLANMAKQAFQERDELVKKLAELQAGNLQPRTLTAATVAVPQAQPAGTSSQASIDLAQAQYDKVLSDIAENGGVLDADSVKALSKAERELAETIAKVRVQEVLSSSKQAEDLDKNEWSKVDAYMAEHYPAAARFSEEVALHMQSDALLTAAVNALLAQGNRVGATELAWKSFETAHGAQVAAADRAKAEETESRLAAKEQVREEHKAAALRDAGVIVGSPGGAGVHENRNAAGASREEIEAAREAMRREGDAPGSPAATRFRELVIGPSLDPSIFGPR